MNKMKDNVRRAKDKPKQVLKLAESEFKSLPRKNKSTKIFKDALINAKKIKNFSIIKSVPEYELSCSPIMDAQDYQYVNQDLNDIINNSTLENGYSVRSRIIVETK